jgi:hypothetical protein
MHCAQNDHEGSIKLFPHLSRQGGDVPRRALNFIEDILSTCYTCTLSAIIHTLNICGHMLLWYVELVPQVYP